jgi:hypothetical protein
MFRRHVFESLHTDLLMTSLIMRLAIEHITYIHFRYCIKRTLILGKVYECVYWVGTGKALMKINQLCYQRMD